MELFVKEDYGLGEFVKNVAGNIEHRCKYCYTRRLEETAKFAKENGFKSYTTTLLSSLYQDHEAIKKAGEYFAKKYSVEFLYRDFRPNFREGNNLAKAFICKNIAVVFFQNKNVIKNK